MTLSEQTTTKRSDRPIEAVKAAVSLEEYAGELTGLKRQGANLIGLCPIHEERTPSFTVYPDQHFYCYGCQHHGDVIDLCELVEKHADAWTAVVSLAIRYDVELPRRSETWRKWSGEKAKVRDAAQRHVASVYQRRLTRVYAPLVLLGGETPDEELEALDELAATLWPFCYELAERRING
jgi:DNA primase